MESPKLIFLDLPIFFLSSRVATTKTAADNKFSHVSIDFSFEFASDIKYFAANKVEWTRLIVLVITLLFLSKCLKDSYLIKK